MNDPNTSTVPIALITFGSRVEVVAKDDAACCDYGTVLDTAPGGWKVVTDQGVAGNYPLADVRPLAPEADAQCPAPRAGNRVVLVAIDRAIPAGSCGEVLETADGFALVAWDLGVELAYQPEALRVIRETPEAVVERLRSRLVKTAAEHRFAAERDAFLRGLTSGGPVSCGPLPRGPSTATAPSGCGVAGLPSAEPDDRVTDDLRDLIASQSLAMATARTKQGVGAAAVAILMAAQGDEIGASIARGLKRVLAGFGDLFDGLDLDAIVREAAAQAGLSTPTADPAPKGAEGPALRFDVGVQVDGVTIGTANLPVLAHESEVVEAIRGDAVLMAKIPVGRRVASVEYVPAKVVRITTVPVETTAPAEAPAAT